jgi:serine/threonine protein kinase
MTDKLVLFTRIKLSNGSVDYLFKIGDFGLSREYSPGQDLTPIPYTPNFQDQRLSSGDYDCSVDCYSLGCIMREFVGYLSDTPDDEFCQLLQKLLQKPKDMSCNEVLGIAWRKLREMTASPVRRAIATILVQDDTERSS